MSVKLLKNVKIVGRVETGSLDSAITPSKDSEYFLSFLTQSKEADTIYKVCEVNDICEVSGKAQKDDKFERYLLHSVTSVRLIEKAK